MLQVRLYRPFPARELLDALPASVRRVAVLDRTKEPGSSGEPLFLDVAAALTEAYTGGERAVLPLVTGGRYGLSSKELTPGMAAGVFAELAREQPRRRFTIGIIDDVSGLSLPYDASLDIEPPGTVRAVFFGLGSDGTVGANKNTIKILGAEENLNAQGYFVYDSKKSGSQTVSHLRFGPQPIRAPYLVQQAGFVGCHHFGLLDRLDVLRLAAPGAKLLLNCSHAPDEVWDALPRPVQEKILAKRIEVYAIDADRIARDADLAGRTNTVLQTCFFAISGVLPREEAIAKIKSAIAKTYGRRGAEVVARNHAAVDRTLEGLHRIEIPGRVTSIRELPAVVPASAPEFVRTVTAAMMAGLRRRPAGQRAAGGRHLSERHRGVREAEHLRAGRGMGPGPVHPVRKLQLRVPAQRDQVHLLRRVAAGRGAGGFPVGAAGRPRPPGHPLHAAGVRGGLHRLRAVRAGMPGRGA